MLLIRYSCDFFGFGWNYRFYRYLFFQSRLDQNLLFLIQYCLIIRFLWYFNLHLCFLYLIWRRWNFWNFGLRYRWHLGFAHPLHWGLSNLLLFSGYLFDIRGHRLENRSVPRGGIGCLLRNNGIPTLAGDSFSRRIHYALGGVLANSSGHGAHSLIIRRPVIPAYVSLS